MSSSRLPIQNCVRVYVVSTVEIPPQCSDSANCARTRETLTVRVVSVTRSKQIVLRCPKGVEDMRRASFQEHVSLA